MKPEEFKQGYGELCGAFPKNFSTEGQEAIWMNKFGNKSFIIFRKMVLKIAESDQFPSINYALSVYKGMAGKKSQDDYRKTFEGHKFPPMSDDEAQKEYEEMKVFIQAYPHPGYPLGADQEDCIKIDEEHDNRMRRGGINPDQMTHPKVGKLLMADLKEIS